MLVRLLLVVALLTAAQAKKPPASRPASRPARSAASQPASQPSGPAKLVAIKDITREMLRQRVMIEGTVTDVVEKPSKTRDRIHIYTVSQDGKAIEIVWWEDLHKKLSAEQTPRKDDRVRIKAKVDEY